MINSNCKEFWSQDIKFYDLNADQIKQCYQFNTHFYNRRKGRIGDHSFEIGIVIQDKSNLRTEISAQYFTYTRAVDERYATFEQIQVSARSDIMSHKTKVVS